MGAKFQKTKYPGVYYRLLARRVDGVQDRAYAIWYKDNEGKPHYKTVGTHFGDGMRPQVANQKRDELLRKLREADKSPADPSPVCTVGMAVEVYERYARAEGMYIDAEMSSYNTHLRETFHHVPIQSVTVDMLSTAKLAMQDAGLAEQTVRHRFSHLRRAINHALETKVYVGVNPLATRRGGAFRLPRPQNARVRFFSPVEAAKLLQALKFRSAQLHAMAELSLRTGMRLTEIFGLYGADVMPQSGVIWVTAKGGKRQPVHADPAVFDLLAPHVRGPQFLVFPSRNGTRKTAAGDTFNRAVNQLGLNDGVQESIHKVTFHTFRHTFASWLAQSGKVTLLELKELLRHESVEMTTRYAHLIPGHQANSLSIVSDLLDHATSPRS